MNRGLEMQTSISINTSTFEFSTFANKSTATLHLPPPLSCCNDFMTIVNPIPRSISILKHVLYHRERRITLFIHFGTSNARQ